MALQVLGALGVAGFAAAAIGERWPLALASIAVTVITGFANGVLMLRGRRATRGTGETARRGPLSTPAIVAGALCVIAVAFFVVFVAPLLS